MQDIQLQTIYRHNAEKGLLYRTLEFAHNATKYEVGAQPTNVIIYEQIESGLYPAGTKWVREVKDFETNFTIVN